MHAPSADYVYAVYLQVRRKWRTVYERHPRSFGNEPSPVPAAPSKRMRSLPREVAIPAAQQLVAWAIGQIAISQQEQLMFMASNGAAPSASSSMIAEAESIPEADVSDADSDA